MGGPVSLLWSARSVAVVGASARPGALGRLPIEFLQRHGYQGQIYPVNPQGGEILGLRAHPTVTAVPAPVDLALIMVGADKAGVAVDDCVAAGVPVAIVGASGFAEAGAEGRARQAELVAQARAAGMRLLGPNCIGATGFHSGLVASFSPMFAAATTRLTAGRVGFVSQSGALGYGAVSLALERGLGLGWAVTTGNEADITALEVLQALAEEPGCAALLGCLESLADIDRLRALADSGTPVALLKSGRSAAGADAAASHTGALATEDRVVDATLRQLGIVRVDDVDELLDVGDAFDQPRRPAGPRVAVVTTSGGSGILAADAIADHGLVLSQLSAAAEDALREIVPAYGAIGNPVDVTAAVMRDPSLVERSLRVIAADPEVDMVAVCFCVLTGDDVAAIVDALRSVAADSGKPILVARTGADHLAPAAGAALRAAGAPMYATPARAIRAAAALWQISRPRPTPGPAVPPGMAGTAGPGVGEGSARCDLRRALSEAELKRALAGAGIATPGGTVTASEAEAEAAVREQGTPAVMKAVGLPHKTDAGAVALGVTAESAAVTYQRLAALSAPPGQVLVEAQVVGGVEMLVGIAPSPLGPVLALGAGGVLAEVLDDVTVRLLPVTELDVREMLSQTTVSRLLAGHRGAPAADVSALIELICRLQGLVADWPPGYALDLNPVIVLPRGAVVLDAACQPPASAAPPGPAPPASTAPPALRPPRGRAERSAE